MPHTSSSSTTPPASGPLAGLRVIELGHFVAAPFCTRLLADLGAEVIKVEPPGGDPVRQWGRQVEGAGAPWWSMHARNKRVITLNLKKPRAVEAGRGASARPPFPLLGSGFPAVSETEP